MVVLALDLGSHTGHALLRADGRIESGTERFNAKAKDGEGMRFVYFKQWLREVKTCNPELSRIAFERVIGGVPGQVYAAQVYGGFLATLMVFCEHHGIPYEGLHVGTIKKAWTGNGAAKKQDMINRCRELSFDPKTDNEADAIAILHIACNRVPALPVERQVKKRPARANPDKASGVIAFDPF
jgi:Holliday junction resolvasome RuvABC endonuclease subunit